MATLEGGCSCAQVRYAADELPTIVTLCHCAMCRRSVGAPSVTWATVTRASLSIRGDTLVWYESSPRAQRGFCSRCGTSLFFAARSEPELLDVTVGSLDDPDACRPDCHIFVPSKLSWVALEPRLPCHVGDSESALLP
jgi:hypothetical protein